MKRAFLVAVVGAACLYAAVGTAQLQAQGPVRGRNVNVIGGPTALTLNPLDMVGDPWRNPQVEPHCAVDSSNPAVIVCSAVDYRWVDLPGGGDGVHLDSWNMVAQSKDSGLTWMSRVHHGFANDPDPNSVLKKYKFAADPIFRPLAAGGFVHVGLAANRGNNGTGAIYSSTWFNLSDKEDDPEPVKNATPGGAIEIETGNASLFHDRPDVAVGEPTGKLCTHDVPRTRADGTREIVSLTKPCTPVYVAWATFVSNGPKSITKFHFAKSYNNGKGWTQPLKLNEMNAVGNGVQVVKFPDSRKIMVLWRRGGSSLAPDAIMAALSTNDGDTFGKAMVLTEVCPVEWDSTPTQFRTRTVPNAAADAQRAYVTWADRRNPQTGMCDPNGPSRAWLMTTVDGEPGTPRLVDTAYTGPGHQLFPSVDVANGKVHVNWLDFRNDASGVFGPTVDEMRAVTNTPPLQPRNRHTADVFGAYGNAGAAPIFNVYQVSEYIYGKPLEGDAPNELRQLHYNVVLARIVRKMNLPFLGDWMQSVGEHMRPKNPVTEPGKWVVNSGGTDMPPLARVFHNFWTDGRNVKLLSNEEYFDAAGNPIPRPYEPPNLDIALGAGKLGTTSIYDPSLTRVACTNEDWTGTKNYEIYGSRTTEGLYAFAPWNNKSNRRPDGTAVQRAFVVVAQHTVPAPSKGENVPTKHLRLTVANPILGPTELERASFKQFEARPEIRLSLLPGTAAARTVYVYSIAQLRPAVQVDVVELEPNNGSIETWADKPGGLRTTVFLNPDNSAPQNLLRPDNVDQTADEFDIAKFEVHDIVFGEGQVEDISLNSTNTGAVVAGQGSNYGTPGWQSPGWQSPGWQSPGWQSPGWQSPGWQSPGWQSPGWQSPGWQSPGWQSTAVSDDDASSGSYRHVRRELKSAANTTSSYDIRAFVNGADPNLVYQLVAYKLYTTTAMDGCAPKLAGHTQVLLNIPNVNVSLANFNSTPEQDVQNATISIEPGGTVWVDLVVFDPIHRDEPRFDPASVVFKATPHAVNTADAEGEEPQTEPDPVISDLILLANPAPPGAAAGSNYSHTFEAIGGVAPYSWSLDGGTLPPGLSLSTAGVLFGTPTTAGNFTFTVRVQDSGTPQPDVDTHSFSVTIVPGAAAQLAFVTQPSNAGIGNAMLSEPQVAVHDQFGNLVTTATHSITVALTNPAGGILSGETQDAAVGGVATFSGLNVNKAATYTLTATSGALKAAISSAFKALPFLFAGSDDLDFRGIEPDDLARSVINGPDVVSTTKIGTSYPLNGMAVVGGFLIAGDPNSSTLRTLDFTGNWLNPEAASEPAACCFEDMVFDGVDLWRAHWNNGIYQVNPATGASVQRSVLDDIVGITKVGATFWITRWAGNSVGTWNPLTDEYQHRFSTVTSLAGGLAYDPVNNILWVGRADGWVDPYDMSGAEPALIEGKSFQPLGGMANNLDGLEVVTEIPPPTVDQQQLQFGSQGWFIGTTDSGSANNQRVAQVVTAGVSRFMTGVAVPVGCHNTTALTLELQGVTEGMPNGTVFATRTFPGIGDFGLNTFYELPLSSPLFVAAGTQFAIVLSEASPETAGNCAIRQGPAEGNPYLPGGAFLAQGTGAWGSIVDLPFKTIVR